MRGGGEKGSMDFPSLPVTRFAEQQRRSNPGCLAHPPESCLLTSKYGCERMDEREVKSPEKEK